MADRLCSVCANDRAKFEGTMGGSIGDASTLAAGWYGDKASVKWGSG